MAGDWIKMRTDLNDDPAVFRIAALTKLDRFSVVGRLHAFWAWASKHSVDGHVDGATTLLIDDVVRCEGFAEALIESGWLIAEQNGIEIPQHERHNSASAKERTLKNARQARWRASKDANLQDVDGHVDGDVASTPSTASSTDASTREEKRREEKKKKPPTPLAGGFERFWTSYPKRKNRGDAEKAWATLKPDEATVSAILQAVEVARASDGWRKDAGQFIPYPGRWLRAKGWLDETRAAGKTKDGWWLRYGFGSADMAIRNGVEEPA